MGKIVILDESTSNKIAAGEVVERPASVIKELVENSIDAGATVISVEIKNGGIPYMKVTDNGSGIAEDDAEIAFERHATSKIRRADDLEAVSTMGFRGEALASIASVSSVELTTRGQEATHGTYIRIQGGFLKEAKQIGCPVGTTFTVRDLFYNTPARFKFLKKDSTEAGYISDIIERIALARPDISFRLVSNHVTVLHSPGNNDLLSAIYSVYGKETARQVSKIEYDDGRIKITGYAGKPEIARANRNQQSLFINGRYVKSKIVSSAIDEAYKTFLMKNKFPFIVINIDINPMLVDVNVHPTKMEVRFSQEQDIFRSVYHAVMNAVLGNKEVKEVQLGEKDRSLFKFEGVQTPKVTYAQQDIRVQEPVSHRNRDRVEPAVRPVASESIQQSRIQSSASVKLMEEKETVPAPIPVTSPAASLPQNPEPEAEKTKKVEVLLQGEIYEQPLPLVSEAKEDVPVVREESKNELEEPCPDSEEQVLLQQNILADSRLVGQVFSTYILLQHEDEMLLIDQHAAHERIMFEKLRTRYRNNESLAQILLAPIVLELTNKEVKLLEAEREFFTKLGFIYEDFGNNCIIVREVPYIMDQSTVKQGFLDIVDHLQGMGTGDYKTIADETLYTIACKAAVKANKKLGDLEIHSLLEELVKMENPYTCPHGRPTILKITKYEIEKMFKRIV